MKERCSSGWQWINDFACCRMFEILPHLPKLVPDCSGQIFYVSDFRLLFQNGLQHGVFSFYRTLFHLFSWSFRPLMEYKNRTIQYYSSPVTFSRCFGWRRRMEICIGWSIIYLSGVVYLDILEVQLKTIRDVLYVVLAWPQRKRFHVHQSS